MKPIKIIVAGDFLPSNNNYTLFEKGDAETLYGKKICKLFADADFSIVNLEGPLTDATVPQSKDGPAIKAPKATIAGIKNLGLSAVALANNHITDYLQPGISDTYRVLQQAGIQYVGNVIREGNCNNFLSIDMGEKKVCVYNVSETFFNQPTKDHDGANVYDEWIVLNEIKELKQRHDFLIVIYHGGTEYFPYPTPQTRRRFHRMADCGADFITAQHTHCVGCEEFYNGSYLLYGQGNFLFARQKRPITQQGLITELEIKDDSFVVTNHLIRLNDNILYYDRDQNMDSFKERSCHVNDEDYLIKMFYEIKVEELLRKFIPSFKGKYPFRRVLNFLPSKVMLHERTTYTKGQLLRNLNVVQGDRNRENIYYVWKYLLDKNDEKAGQK